MKKQLFNKAKKVIAFTLSAVMTFQMIPAYASEENHQKEKAGEYTLEELKSLVYSNETTEEVLDLINHGLDTETFFMGDLTSGTTKEDLIRWKEEGKDIRDIIHERALESSANISEVYNNEEKEITADNTPTDNGDGTYTSVYEFPKAYAFAGGDGKYYLTQVENYFDGCEVNLGGTGYAGELFNPKTNGTGSSEPRYISLGGEQAMCCTYTGHASLRTDHNYVENSINSLRNNPYFRGGSSYPVKEYFRGAAYAYETLAYPDSYSSGAGMFDADKQELARKAGGELVYRSGKSINYAVFQIITWRIAQGSFNPDDMSRECEIAKTIFGQMYPPEDWSYTYYNQIESFYEYYALCAKECASGKYNQKYSDVRVKYWQVQGADSANWQDFITWDLATVPVKRFFGITKTGRIISDSYYPNATFYVYSDSRCTNKIGEFTTNASGQAKIDRIVEGIYYLKEINAPTGTIKNNSTITLAVEDDVDSANISNEEYKNGAFFRKYDRYTKEAVKRSGKYAIYEYVNGGYLKLGTFNFLEKGFTNSKGVKVPDYSYVLNTQEMTYHREDGSTYNVNTSSLIYTPVNQGKFKIVEEAAPEGYMLDTSGKTFTMNLTEQGYINDFTTYETGLKDSPNMANVKIRKYDYFTGADLSGAAFKIQEKIGETWYDVGELAEKTETDGENTYPIYTTLNTNRYEYHDNNGKVIHTRTSSQNPLICTSYNDGIFRIVETKAPEGYVGNFTRRFTVRPEVNNYTYEFTSYSTTSVNSVTNRGISITVKTLKYDEITKEVIRGIDVPATMTVYEHISDTDKWVKVGDLNYSSDGEYVMDKNYSYKIHDSKGNEIRTGINGTYLPGKLYYTSANMGRFKVVEAKAPTNYLLGILNKEGIIKTYEEEFTITPDMEDGKVIDLTDLVYAAKDTGVSSNIEVSKYDLITRSKVESGDAEFTVYENVNNNWLEVGKLVYDGQAELYKSEGMKAVYHNSMGEEVLSTTLTDKSGLTYTSANMGKFKVAETKAPAYYQNSGFSKEFTITAEVKDTIRFNSFSQGAKDIGISGTISVEKYDIVTQEQVNTFDAEFTVYEKVGNKWLESGRLKYDTAEKRYTGKDVNFTFHNEDGTVADTKDIKGYEKGRLYYTSANQGRFKVVETKAPLHYHIGTFNREFTLTKDNQENSYVRFVNAAQNNGEYTYVELLKYDAITKKNVEFTNAVFTVQEYAGDEWLDVCNLNFNNETGHYESKGMTVKFHNSNKEQVYAEHSGKLYYTTANKGRYRVIETSAPTNYVTGSEPYTHEFNVTDSRNNITDITDIVNAPYDLGIYGTVEVAKFDRITKEKVKTGDAEFKVYEYVANLDEWFESGILKYDEQNMIYTCEGVEFTFHNEDGTDADTKDILDFEKGRLYYTSANKGNFKVEETSAPENYILEEYSVKFNICNNYNDEIKEHTEESIIQDNSIYEVKSMSYSTTETNAAQDKGITGNLEVLKTDKETDKPLSGAKFALQEWSVKENDWLYIGDLTDSGNGLYTTKDAEFNYHTGRFSEAGEEILETHTELVYTSANMGKFKVTETKAPEGYLNDDYTYEVQLTEEQTFFDLTDKESRATDTPIRVSLSKKSITTGKDITGAELTVKDIQGNVIDKWISDGKEHIISGIKPGKYIFIEETAPEGYVIANQVEFEVFETYEIQKVEMFDEEVKGKIVIIKTDKSTGHKLAGAKFELKAEDGSFSQILVTDENGYAESEIIRFGIYDENGKYKGSKKYTLTEIVSPSGYDIDRTPKTVTFEYKDDKTEVVEVKIDITNTKTPEVKTGDYADMGLVLLTLTAIAALTAGIFMKKKLKFIR